MSLMTNGRLSVPKDLARSVHYYAEDERKRIENPEVRKLITDDAFALMILQTQCEKANHYPPKDSENETAKVCKN